MMTPATFDLSLYIVLFGLCFASAVLLVLSNYIVTSKVSLPLNEPMKPTCHKGLRLIGWLLLLFILALVMPFLGKNPTVMAITFFVLSSCRILNFSWPCLINGHEKHIADVKRYYVETTASKFWTIILLKLIPLYIIGMIVSMASSSFGDKLWIVNGIGSGIGFFAIYFAMIDAFLRFRYKREAKKVAA